MRAEISIVIKDDDGDELCRYDKAAEDRDLEPLLDGVFQNLYYSLEDTFDALKLEALSELSNPERKVPKKRPTKAKSGGKTT